MNQSNFIFFALFLAFVVYVTMRGELPTYMGFFVPNPNAGNMFASLSPTSSDTKAKPKTLTIFGHDFGITGNQIDNFVFGGILNGAKTVTGQ